MFKIVALFLITIFFIASGSIIQKNPTWLQKYRKIPDKIPLPSVVPTSRTYLATSGAYQFVVPEGWDLRPNTPGCGPVWFPRNSNQSWFSICGPATYPTPTTNTSSITLAGIPGSKLEKRVAGGLATEIYLPVKTGTLVINFTNLEKDPTQADTAFSHALQTLEIN